MTEFSKALVERVAEEWRPVALAPARYQVSSLGRVRNARRKLLAIRKDRKGYFRASLYANGKTYCVTVSSLVAAAFLGPRPVGLHVAHLDGTRDNDVVDNLAYVTPAENMGHKRLHGTAQFGERHGKHKLTVEQAAEILDGGSARTLANRFGVDRATIYRIRRGETWAAAIADYRRARTLTDKLKG